MGTSQAEVSKHLRETIREMVKEGKTNEEIYIHLESLDTVMMEKIRKLKAGTAEPERVYGFIQSRFGRGIRQSIQNRVEAGQSMEQINGYIRDHFGREGLIAIPRQKMLWRLSYGLPYIIVGIIIVIALWIAWWWKKRGDDEQGGDDDFTGDESDKEKRLLELSKTMENPLH